MKFKNKKLEDLFLDAKRRGKRHVKNVVQNQCWTTQEFLEFLDINETYLEIEEGEGNFFSLSWRGQKYWPKFQIPEGEKRTPKNFDVVLAFLQFHGHDQWSIHGFMTSANLREEKTAFELLCEGELEKVYQDVRTLGKHGAR